MPIYVCLPFFTPDLSLKDALLDYCHHLHCIASNHARYHDAYQALHEQGAGGSNPSSS
jgi:hypothetical protein